MSHHHHHQNQQVHHHQPPRCCHACNTYTTTTTTCCCSPPPNSTSQSNSDQLLQALTTHLLIQTQPQHQPQPRHVYLKKPQQRLNPTPTPTPDQHSKDEEHHLLLLRSLVKRVAALESSLSNAKKELAPPQSLKHLAAATIQRHFRRFLARRSRTLRDLKELATVKSHAAALRSALSDRRLKKDPRALSRRAMDLLFQLDSIQSSDPMIREGKRSISRELVRLSEFVEKVLMREEEEDELNEGDFHSKRGRRVSFVESRNEDQVFDDLPERVLEEENEEEEEEEEEEETNLRGLGFYDKFSDDEERPEVRYGVNAGFQQQRRKAGLAAPIPVTMEPRRSGSIDKVPIEH